MREKDLCFLAAGPAASVGYLWAMAFPKALEHLDGGSQDVPIVSDDYVVDRVEFLSHER